MLPSQSPRQAVERTVREEWGRILAGLVKSFGDIQLAEDCLQDALARAIEIWPTTGMPRVPAAWLITTARRRAIDRLRREARFATKLPELVALMDTENTGTDAEDIDAIPDKRLELIFTCCHPALAQKSQVALTLRTLGGLRTEAIAAAFLDKPAAMAQRLVRTKQKIAAAGIPYEIPSREMLPERVTAVLAVIYLIFNAGYSDAGSGKCRLGDEAIRLARIVHHLLPDQPEVAGLLALMLLHDARRAARVDASGKMVALQDQNRNRWDRAKIAQGDSLLRTTLTLGQPGPYQLQAAISALHARSPSWEQTDWAQIATLYALLYQVQPSTVVLVNQAVAISYALSVADALALLTRVKDDPHMAGYQPYHAARADLLDRAGDTNGARASYVKAIALTDQPIERAFLQRKHDAILR